MISSDFNTRYFFFLLLGAGIIVALLLWPFFSAIVVAGVLAVLFQSFYKWSMRKTHGRKGISATLVCLIVALLIILPTLSLIGLVGAEVRGIYMEQLGSRESIARNVALLESALRSAGLPGLDEILDPQKIMGQLEKAGSLALGALQAVYVGTTQFALWIFVMFFTLFYFLVDGKSLVTYVMRISPLPQKQEYALIRSFESMGRAILKGTLLIGLVQGFFGGVFLAIAGFPSPFTWGVVMVILSIIPLVGAGLVLFPASVWALVTGDIVGGVILLVGGVFVTTIDNYLRPKLVGQDTTIHPLLIFFATLGGLMMFGVMGFLIGPIVVALFLSLLKIYETEFADKLREYNK